MRNAYLNSRDVNLIVVDWSVYAWTFYTLARYRVPNVGKAIGRFIQLMVEKVDLDLNNTGLVGFSLGAHVSGIAGRFLEGNVNFLIGKKYFIILYLKYSVLINTKCWAFELIYATWSTAG